MPTNGILVMYSKFSIDNSLFSIAWLVVVALNSGVGGFWAAFLVIISQRSHNVIAKNVSFYD